MLFRAVVAALAAVLALDAQDPLESEGFRHFYNLEYDEAIEDFARQIARTPDSPDAYNHLAQTILFRDMLRAGALESELVTGNNPFLRRPKVEVSAEDQRKFDGNINKAITLADAELRRNARDTGALYALGVSYGLRANYNFLVRKAWRDALRDATTARKYHNRVTEIDPSFVDARLTQGAHDYILGSLPLHWRLVGFLVGMRGDKERGIRTLETVAREGKRNRIDAEVLLGAIYRRERQPRKALPIVEDLMRRFPRNYILYFELAQIWSDIGDKEKALAPLARVEALRREGAPGFAAIRPEKIRFAEGNIRFWYNDLDRALEDMKAASAGAEDLDLNTGVLSLMRLGQIYDLKGQRAQAMEAYRRAAQFAPGSEAAREASRYLSSPYRRQRG